MAIDATITLHNLTCIRENTSGGVSPYIWPVAVLIDDASAAVSVTAPSDALARVILKSGMHGGQSAAIPATLGVLTTRIEDDTNAHHLVLAVALWQQNDTPDDSVTAGYLGYVNGLQAAIAANLLQLDSPMEQAAAITAVKAAVKAAVTTAITNSLSDYQKLKVKLDLMTIDAFIDDSSTVFSPVVPTPFTVTFSEGGTTQTPANSYSIAGALTTATVLCETETAAVKAAQAAVDAVDAQIATLDRIAQKTGATPPPIPADLQKKLTAAKAQLAKAQQALDNCRARSLPPELPRGVLGTRQAI
jgi:hypothetical protein